MTPGRGVRRGNLTDLKNLELCLNIKFYRPTIFLNVNF